MNYFDRKDHFWHKAKQEGYRSRAAYKLLQLQNQYQIFRNGDRVVDLGCAPGGWLHVIAKAIGPGGKVVGLDRRNIEVLPFSNVYFVQGDIHSKAARKQIITYLSAHADIVTSDMSPDLSGIRFRDHHLACELVIAGLQFCKEILKPGGTYLSKSFEGEESNALLYELRDWFTQVRRIIPDASRKGSSEIYMLAKGFKLHREKENY
jgi:23S rRNA (uridine2552-2'-O)-methyltransferase